MQSGSNVRNLALTSKDGQAEGEEPGAAGDRERARGMPTDGGPKATRGPTAWNQPSPGMRSAARGALASGPLVLLLHLLASPGVVFGGSRVGDPASGDAAAGPTGAAMQTEEHPEDARRVTNSVGMSLALVPAGEFRMGASDDDDLAEKAERPQHRVRIRRAYYLGVHEVTLGQFRAFVG